MLMPQEKEPSAKERSESKKDHTFPYVNDKVVLCFQTTEISYWWLLGGLVEGVLIWILIIENYVMQVRLSFLCL